MNNLNVCSAHSYVYPRSRFNYIVKYVAISETLATMSTQEEHKQATKPQKTKTMNNIEVVLFQTLIEQLLVLMNQYGQWRLHFHLKNK